MTESLNNCREQVLGINLDKIHRHVLDQVFFNEIWLRVLHQTYRPLHRQRTTPAIRDHVRAAL